MGFQFPNSPTDGTTFAPAGGPTYVFSSGVWKLAGGGSAFVVSSDTAPVAPFPGMLWFETDTGALYFWYVDANSSQWVQVNFTPSSGQTADARNRIVNPAMQISQENGNTSGTTTNYFPADQWAAAFTTTGAITSQRIQTSVTPNNSQNRIRLIVSTADASLAAGENCLFEQRIEGSRIADFGWGTANAKQVVVRFGFKGPEGTYSMSLRENSSGRSYVANFTISAAQANVDTVQIFVVPGDTVGTWLTDNSLALRLNVVVAAGSNNVGVAGWQAGQMLATSANTNGLATVNNTFSIFDVGLYLDPLATGLAPPWQQPDEAQELLACQRYWYGTASAGGALGNRYGPAGAGVMDSGLIIVPTNMRGIPAVSAGTITYTNCSALALGVGGSGSLGRHEVFGRVTVTAAGLYRAQLQDVVINARM